MLIEEDFKRKNILLSELEQIDKRIKIKLETQIYELQQQKIKPISIKGKTKTEIKKEYDNMIKQFNQSIYLFSRIFRLFMLIIESKKR